MLFSPKFLYLCPISLSPISQLTLKEKKELNKTKHMVDFINSNKEKHADLVNKVLQEKEAPFVDMLEKPELEELYRLIKGAEAS